MISVGDKIYLNGIITKQNENPLSDIWAFCPAKGEIDSNAGKLERPTCMNCCIRKISSLLTPRNDSQFFEIHFSIFEWWKFQSITMDNYDDKRRTTRAASIRDSALEFNAARVPTTK